MHLGSFDYLTHRIDNRPFLKSFIGENSFFITFSPAKPHLSIFGQNKMEDRRAYLKCITHFFFLSLLIQNKSPMNSESLVLLPLLKPISLSLLQEIEQSQIKLEAHAKIQGKTYDIVLVDDIIMLYSDRLKDSLPIGHVRLDFSLKFQRIFLRKSFSERELKGFKLMNDFSESIQFCIEFANLTNLWIEHLSRMINESGFQYFYKPVRILGKGSTATVYQILRLNDGKRFAAKVFAKAEIKNNTNRLNSFLNELEIMRSIEHNNLLKLEGVFESDNSFYVIMETLGGGNLFQNIIKRAALSCEQIKIIMRSILKGLAELEENGIVHRDIKLENLMLRQKNHLQPVIVDFGLAIQEDDEDYIYYQCGTPGYISPEIVSLKRGEKITSKSDVFSAGVLLHVLLTKRYLFEGKTSKEIFENNRKMNFDLEKPDYKKYDQELMDLMKKMLEKDPSNRLFASQCLQHPSLFEQKVANDEKFQISPMTACADYHF